MVFKNKELYKNDLSTSQYIYNDLDIKSTSAQIFQKNILEQTKKKPSSLAKWEAAYGNINWETIWKMVKNIKEPKLKSFVYKVIHRVYPTKIHLFKWKIEDSDLCKYCNMLDTYEHFFYTCSKIKSIWNEVLSYIKQHFDTKIELDEKKILVIYNDENKSRETFINKIINIAKCTIGKFKYGNHPNINILFENELRIRNII